MRISARAISTGSAEGGRRPRSKDAVAFASIIRIACFALPVAACGGGGGGGVLSTPPPISVPPPPLPPPPPPPAPPVPPPLPSGPLGLTGKPFVTAGASWSGITGEEPQNETAELRTGSDLVSISYSQADNSYTISLPDYGQGKLQPRSGNGSFILGATTWLDLAGVSYDLVTAAGTEPYAVSMLYPADPTPGSGLKLTYTSSGQWSSYRGKVPKFGGVFAYGIPTAPGSMPVTGKATYNASVSGHTRTYNDIWGTALLEFDFGLGSLSGSMRVDTSDGWDLVPLGTFTFRDTVYSPGSTTFAGRLSVPGSDQTGSFAGQFTGPGGPEFLASFRSPAFNTLTGKWDEIAGVWTGKRK